MRPSIHPGDVGMREVTEMTGGMATDESSNPASAGHVFISHHSSQYEAAKRVKAALAQAGIRGWLAPDDVDPGSAFDVQILDAMKNARAVVLLLCAQSDRSRHVKREVMLADDASTPVFPVRLEPVKAEGLAYWLKDYQWIDWFDGKGDGLDRLVAAVAGELGSERAPIPAATGTRRVSRQRWWIGGGAAALAVVGAAAWFALAYDPGPEPYVTPGLWLNKREMIAITYPPQVAAEETRQIKEMVESDPNPEECISEAVARSPDVNLFDPGNKGKCALNGFQFGSDRLSGTLLCPIQGAEAASLSVAFTGNYTKTTIEMDSMVTIERPGGVLRFKARDSSHWVADKCNADNR